MDTKIPYEDKEDEIREALKKLARSGKKLDYRKFGELVGIATQGPWKPILDRISLKESAAGPPDREFLPVIGTRRHSHFLSALAFVGAFQVLT